MKRIPFGENSSPAKADKQARGVHLVAMVLRRNVLFLLKPQRLQEGRESNRKIQNGRLDWKLAPNSRELCCGLKKDKDCHIFITRLYIFYSWRTPYTCISCAGMCRCEAYGFEQFYSLCRYFTSISRDSIFFIRACKTARRAVLCRYFTLCHASNKSNELHNIKWRQTISFWGRGVWQNKSYVLTIT